LNARHDIVIVGHGAAGLSAAVAAAEAAPRASIAVLERTNEAQCGGNTRWSPSNMRLRSVKEVSPGFVDDMLAATAGREAAYYRRLADEAPAAARWLRRHGVEFHSPPYYLSKGPPRIQPVGGGLAIVSALAKAARAAGVQFVYECAATGLEGRRLQTSKGALEANAIVLACGGFQGSAPMRRDHLGLGGESLRLIAPGTGSNDGSGIRMALAAGAKPAGDWKGMHIEPVDARSRESAPVVLVYPYGIVVDAQGRRFADEGAGLMHETWEDLARRIHFETPGSIAWSVHDASLLDIEGYQRAIRSEVPPVRAESIAGLGARAGIANLEATVARYNAAATGDAARFDPHRADGLAADASLSPPKSNWARPLMRAPFLAWPLVGAIAYTFGGIATDEEARVLGAGGPIAGLYAAGEITGHFYGTAPNAVAVLRALVYGRIAGRNAACGSLTS
jgi:tricarballylate dehydrogenase